jgi:hypothetical protein
MSPRCRALISCSSNRGVGAFGEITSQLDLALGDRLTPMGILEGDDS